MQELKKASSSLGKGSSVGGEGLEPPTSSV